MFGGRMLAYWRDEALPAHLAAAERWKATDPAIEPDERLLAGVRELAGRCPLLVRLQPDDRRAKVTDAILGRFLTLAAPGRRLTSGMFLRGFPSPTVDAETELEGLAEQLRDSDELRTLVGALQRRNCPTHSPADLPAGGSPPSPATSTSTVTRSTTDFVVPTQAGDPLPVLISLKTMTQRPGRDPRARQRAIITERDTLVDATARSLGPLRRRLLGVLLDWAQRCGPDREQALFYMGAGWPALRRLALELGRRLAESGSLRTAEDIFFLQTPELRTAISAREAGRATPELASVAHQRRELRDARKRLHPPPVVPQGYKLRFGPFDMSAFETQRRNVLEGTTLRGFAVSPGRTSAAASVILSPADFSRMEPGTILVCPTTTPAWTPLLAGPRHGDRCRRGPGPRLDRGARVRHPRGARDWVRGRRIRHGQRITVDGDQGLVVLGRRLAEAALATSIRTCASSLRHCAARQTRPSGAPRSSPRNRGWKGTGSRTAFLPMRVCRGLRPMTVASRPAKRNAGPATSRQTITRTPSHPTTRATWPPGWLPVRPGWAYRA